VLWIFPKNILAHWELCDVRAIFKTEHTLYGILMETGSVRDAE
jgi:hypothetical protein